MSQVCVVGCLGNQNFQVCLHVIIFFPQQVVLKIKHEGEVLTESDVNGNRQCYFFSSCDPENLILHLPDVDIDITYKCNKESTLLYQLVKFNGSMMGMIVAFRFVAPETAKMIGRFQASFKIELSGTLVSYFVSDDSATISNEPSANYPKGKHLFCPVHITCNVLRLVR